MVNILKSFCKLLLFAIIAIGTLWGVYQLHLLCDDRGYYEYLEAYKWFEPKAKYVLADLNEKQRGIAEQFSAVALEASNSCNQDIENEFNDYTNSLDEKFEKLSTEIKKRVKNDLDGFISRATLSERERSNKLRSIILTEYGKTINSIIDDLLLIRQRNISMLNDRLLVSTSFKYSRKIDINHSVSQEDIQEVLADLQSAPQMIGKSIEEAFTFIPIGGDIYDIFRTFVYDYRFEKSVGDDVNNSITMIRSDFDSKVYPKLKRKLIPSTRKIWYECVSEFDPAVALNKLKEY